MIWEYMMATDGPVGKPYLVRKSTDGIQDWNVTRRTWQDNLDRNDAFLGLDVHYRAITEAQALEIMARFDNGNA